VKQLWALVACLCQGAAHAACPLPADAVDVLQAPDIQLQWRAEPAPVQVGRPFALRVTLCPAGAVLKRVDASMPEHRHGMNYKPSVRSLGDGLWQVEGMLWHMGGRWELRLDAEYRGRTQELRQSVQLR
jgi:hypothetical protein